jgi:hypothetical protein
MPKAPAVDPDAQAFITAASITDNTQKNAINNLVIALKGYSIWTKFKAIYPVVGGVASSHAVNLKSPGTYNLSFQTGWNHSANGMTPNGLTYANTLLTPSIALSSTNAHHSSYFRTNRTIALQSAYGAYVSPTSDFQFYPYTFNIGWISDIYDNSQSRITSNLGNSTGFVLMNRGNANSHKIFRNGTQLVATTNTTNGTPPNIPYYIGRVNLNGVPSFGDVNQICFYSIGDGLTDTEAANFYTAVQAFQTTLSRQV